MNQRSYYAILPADVRYCKALPPAARLLYAEITALSNEKGYCWATNSYFAELYETSIKTISRWISALQKQGFIHLEIDQSLGNERQIYLSSQMSRPYGQKCPDPMDKNADSNNKVINNTSNTTNNNVASEKEILAKSKKAKKQKIISPEIVQIVEAWNEITGQDIKPTTEAHHPLINKRLSEGYTVEDFKTVIQAKYDEWKDNPEMFIYIRPSTILNGHFEGYFNVAKMPKPKKTNDVQKFRIEAEAYENEYPEAHAQYITALNYAVEHFKNLFKSDCRFLNFIEFLKYKTRTIYPAMNLISERTIKDLMMECIKELNLDTRKANSVFDYFTKKLKEC